MKSVAKVDHQAPGFLPGTVHFKLAYADDETYRYAGEHLYSVLSITLSEAIHGFHKEWLRPDGKAKVVLVRPSGAHNGQVLRIANKGMFNPGASSPYGDIFVRIHIKMPSAAQASQAVEKASLDKNADIVRDNEIEIKDDGEVWRRYSEADEDATLSTDPAPR